MITLNKLEEIAKREKMAMSAIKKAFETEDNENGVTLFVSHQLEEIDEAYWERHLGSTKPAPVRVLDLLVLQSHWGDDDDDGIDTVDFTIPKAVADYVISVRFDENGQVDDISMES